MNKLFDLRFIIGLFFLLIGTLIICYALFFSGIDAYKKSVNLCCGGLLVAFGLGMWLTTGKNQRIKE